MRKIALIISLMIMPLLAPSWYSWMPIFKPDVKKYIVRNMKKYKVNLKHTNRYYEVITNQAKRYNLDPFLVARITRNESEFKWWAKSPKGALGPMQVMPIHWEHALYHIDNGKLGRKIHKYGITNTKQFYTRIGYGIELGCNAFKFFKAYAGGDIPLALIGFNGGQNKPRYKKARTNRKYLMNLEYVKNVLYE